jgi:hypothetical protein
MDGTIKANNGERKYECHIEGCEARILSWRTSEKHTRHKMHWHGPYICSMHGCSRGVRNGFGTQKELDTHRIEAHRRDGQVSSNPNIHEDTTFGSDSSACGISGQFSISSSCDPPSRGLPTNEAPSALGSTLATQQYNVQANWNVPEDAYAGVEIEMGTLASGNRPNKCESSNCTRQLALISPGFEVQDSSFFKWGQVFKTHWSEPKGNAGNDISNDKSKTFTKVRPFIVINAMEGHCLCLPVLTYGRQGVLKHGVHAHDHAPIYTHGENLVLLKGEEERGLTRTAIAIVPDSPSVVLLPESRLNYAKLYPIEYNVKVCSMGQVWKGSQRDLIQDYNEVHPPLETRGVPLSPPLGSSSTYPPFL